MENLKPSWRLVGNGAANVIEVDLHKLTREFLVKLWVDDIKMRNPRWFSATSALPRRPKRRPVLKQPPISQSLTDFFDPQSPQEAKVAPLLARSNLLITRDIEWANLVLGFEQPVGFIREQSNIITRQLLRLRRPFVAYITDALGNKLFRVCRPFWWITSSIYAEIDGKKRPRVGVCSVLCELGVYCVKLLSIHKLLYHQRNKQFAVVENPGLWNWTFTLKDINGEVLAQIDRDWRGFGFEILTDAGQYVIRFGSSDPSSKIGLASAIEDLEVRRKMTLAERAVTVAFAISLDNDYFSRHGGWGLPFLVAEE
ncbi:hypothetical protein AAZX31_11G091100 [Glycine max]